MNELDKVLAKLAEKLGTSVDHLWAVLIRQARVEIISDAVWIVVNVVILYAMYHWWKKIRTDQDYDRDVETIAAIVISLPVAIMTICSVVGLLEIPTLIFNPEYWALKQIMETFGK